MSISSDENPSIPNKTPSCCTSFYNEILRLRIETEKINSKLIELDKDILNNSELIKENSDKIDSLKIIDHDTDKRISTLESWQERQDKTLNRFLEPIGYAVISACVITIVLMFSLYNSEKKNNSQGVKKSTIELVKQTLYNSYRIRESDSN